MKSSAALALGCLALVILLLPGGTNGESCSYRSTCRSVYYVSSGWFGWGKTAKYRNVACTKSATCTLSWNAWSSCSESCDGGRRSRTGTCTASVCSKSRSESEDCNQHRCPRNGGWTSWSPYRCSGCSATCGNNIVNTCTRSRSCSNPTPAYGGANCVGAGRQIDTRACVLPNCPIHGNWTNWSDWNCDGCENKFCRKSRSCTNPAPAYGGRGCSGPSSDTQYQTCDPTDCHDNGGWSEFSSPWTCGTCSRTCGGGTQTCSVTRTCLQPPCQGSNSISRSQSCNTQPCPVNGQWSNWYDGRCGECDADCGPGKKTCRQFRLCDNPAPAHGGTGCVGQGSKEVQLPCNNRNCPVNGGWSEFGPVRICGDCSTTCETGQRTCRLFRQCNNPAPDFGGQDCQGSNIQTVTETCNLGSCYAIGTWSNFSSDWTCGTCSRTCGGGTQTCSVTRTCLQPPCQGSNRLSISEACNTEPCPVDGGWSQWSDGACDECDVTCGGEGEKRCQQYRLCNDPAPANGGAECAGEATRTVTSSCMAQRCPIDGGWSEPGTDKICGECSASCGPGTKVCKRFRRCNNPRPDFGGQDCEGSPEVEITEPCNQRNCSVEVPTCKASCDAVPPGYVAYYPHDRNCNQYYYCERGRLYTYTCYPGLFWNDPERKCDYLENVNCHQCMEGYLSCLQADGGIMCYQREHGCPTGTTDTTIIQGAEDDDPMACAPRGKMIPDNTDDCRGFYFCAFTRWVHMDCPSGTGFSSLLQTCVPEECQGANQSPLVVCPEGDRWPVESRSCNTYTVCSNQRLVYQTCANGTRFHPENGTCVNLEHVPCEGDDLVDTDCEGRAEGETFAHPSCNMYNQCVHGEVVERMCATEEPFFNPTLGVCTWPQDSPCGASTSQ